VRSRTLVTLKDLSEYLTVGFVGSMSSLFVDEGVPLLRGQNVHPFSLDLSNLKFISHETHDRWKKSELRAGDVVIVRVGYPGTACVIPEGLGQLNAASLVIVRPNPELLNPYYLAYVLNSPWGKAQIRARLVGSAQQVFNTTTAADLEIPAPSLKLQNRIAAVLLRYDDLIANNTRRIKILEEMAKLIYREWFMEFKAPGVKLRKATADEKKVTGKDVFPEGWAIKALGELAEDVRRSCDPTSIDPDTPYIGLEHMPRQSIALDSWGKAQDVQSTKLSFCKGEILFGKIRPYFHKVGVAPIDGVCSTDIIVIVPIEKALKALVLAVVSSTDFVNHATQTSQGTKMPRANWDILAKYRVPLPPKTELLEFNRLIEGNVKLIMNFVSANRNLRQTRDLLLPKLVSGEIEL